MQPSYASVRAQTEAICAPLEVEDYVVQPIVDVSPPKWHLGHTTWFFETFLLKEHRPGYRLFHPEYNFVFNSYYETVGTRVIRTDRGNLSRPTVKEVMDYRHYVDHAMQKWLEEGLSPKQESLLMLGLQHEQQHQELLLTDIKYILGHNPLFPPYQPGFKEGRSESERIEWKKVEEGLYPIGFEGHGFHFDNEKEPHKVWIPSFEIRSALVTQGDWLEFLQSGGYSDFRNWLSEGWSWVKENGISAPMYWHYLDGEWMQYTLGGLTGVVLSEPVKHISYYEADAFARWAGYALPTEQQWEAANSLFPWGQRWEWTQSAYLPYPGFKAPSGAVGEYNGKFMVNQMVLRGCSIATPDGHSRPTYRNFFHPPLRWQFNGLRLVKHL
jgi:ergothioneine biosynthesis protein EgtB